MRPLKIQDCRDLLATTSVVALLTAAMAPAHAQSFQINSSPPTNIIITGTFTEVTVASPSVKVTGSVINNGILSAPSRGPVFIGQGTISGGITNNGTISAGRFTGLAISLTASVSGGISNSGTGIIRGQSRAIYIGNTSDNGNFSKFSGGITNSGSISSSGGIGILIGANSPDGGGINTFVGNIINTTMGTITAAQTAIGVINAQSFVGGITNNGTISAGAGGIRVATTSRSSTANSTFSGGVTNTGLITAAGTGVQLSSISNFSGGIINLGTITAGGAGIDVGTASGPVSTFAGGITNQGVISAAGAGVLVGSAVNFAGGVSNNGTILGGNGVVIGSSVEIITVPTYSGGVTNTGTISATNTGILFLNTSSVSVFDSGVITGADGTAIQFSGGVNTLTLGSGFVINGNVLGAGTDIFQLGGSGTGTFNLSNIGSSYTGFTTFNVIGGTWVTTGTNASNWSISSGATLQLGNGTTSGLITGNFTDNGTLAFSESATTAIASTISGAGSVVQMGPGTVVLSGNNSYTGTTTVDAGTLQAGAVKTFAPLSAFTVAPGATLDLNSLDQTIGSLAGAGNVTLGSATLTTGNDNTSTSYAGVISGTGSLAKIGAGTLTLTGANIYSGGTSLNAGTLAIGNNAALGTGGVTLAGGTVLQAAASGLSLANTLTLNGAATIDSQSNVLSLNGVISGSGSFTKIGNGFVTLNGANTYTGGTAVLGGTLIGTTASLQGNILDNAALVFDQTTGGTYAGSLSGNGTLTIHGAGAVTLTGDDSGFTGETRLAQGALAVGTASTPNATLGGTVDVFSGGLLSGHGTVGSVNNFAGTVMPGGSIGVLTVNGSYTQSSSGTLLIQVTPTESSLLRVTGPALLGGTLELAYEPGTYSPRTYTFITSPSISGAFSAVDSVDPPSLSQGLSIDPATGQLVLGGFSIAPSETTIFPDMTTVLVQNAQQANSIVLDRLNDRLAGNGMAAGGIAAAPGMQLAQLGNSNLANTEAFATALPQALMDRGAWFRGIGSFGSVDGNSVAPGFDTASGGFLAGFDQSVAPGVIAGFAAGYTHSNVNDHSTSSGDVNTARVMVYGGGPLASGLWSATAGYAHDSISTQRGLPGIGSEQASYDGNELTLGAQWSQPLHFGDAVVLPQAGARFLRLFEGGFAETGASGFNVVGQSNSATSLQPFVGATASRTFVTDSGTQITPMLALGYAREVANDGRSVEVNAIDGTTFLVDGIRPSRDILTVGGGVTVKARDNLYVYADYDASLPVGNTVNQTFSLGVRIPFPPYNAATNEPEMQAVPTLEGIAGTDQPELQAKQQQLFNQMFSAPADLDATLGYAAVSARLGDNEGAAEALERLLLFNPNLPTAQLELGVLYYRMGSFATARAYLDKARSLNPSPDVLARIDEYTEMVAAAQQTNALTGTFSFGTQYQTDANVAPSSALINSPIGAILLNNPFVKHDDTSFFASGSLLYSYGLGTQDGDAIEVTGTGFANHYLEFNRLDLDFGEATVGPRLRYPNLGAGPIQMATVKPYAILNEVGLGEHQYFWTYGAGLETTAVLWNDLSARMIYEFRQKDFTNAPDRPLSTGLSGNDNLVRLMLSKPLPFNSQVLSEFDYLDQSTGFAYYANNTYSASLGYGITYDDPMRLLNRPWETAFYGSRTWSIYEAPDPCCNTSGSSTMFSTSARDDRHWRFGITQSFQLTANTALVAQLQRDIVSSNLPLYAYTSDSFLVDLKVNF